MCSKLLYLVENHATVKTGLAGIPSNDNVGQMADWLSGEWPLTLRSGIVHAK